MNYIRISLTPSYITFKSISTVACAISNIYNENWDSFVIINSIENSFHSTSMLLFTGNTNPLPYIYNVSRRSENDGGQASVELASILYTIKIYNHYSLLPFNVASIP
jgi:CRISPR/Cas system CSM-associated protein Csm4 (group 5 of RAMP superfamily)